MTGTTCPFLGLYNDGETRYGYPNLANYCHAQPSPFGVELAYQASTCLGESWSDCPRYLAVESGEGVAAAAVPAPRERLQQRRPRPRRLRWVAAAVVVAVVLGGLFFLFRSPIGTSQQATSVAAVAPSDAATAALAPSATSTLQASPAPTATPSSSPVPPEPSSSPGNTPSPSPSPRPTQTPAPTATPTPTRTDPPTPTLTDTLTPTPTSTSSPTPSPQPAAGATFGPWTVVHVLQPGETLARIAARYGSSVEAIAESSGLENPDLVYRGQILTVPLTSAEAALAARPVLTGSREAETDTPSWPLPAPTLLAPEGGATHSGPVELRWQWEGALELGQYFAVLVWWDEAQSPCCFFFTTDQTYSLDLANYPPGPYRWTVRAMEGGQAGTLKILRRFLTPPGELFSFTWSGSE